MSTEYTPEIEYRCLSDCREAGCPGHVMRLELHHTSNTVAVIVDGERWHSYDCNLAEACVQSYGLWKSQP